MGCRIHVLVLAGLTALAGTARADHGCCAPACPPPCGPVMKTVCCTEWVPEQYQATRTVYKTECREEAYTAYRCEMVPEVRTRVCTTWKHECETVMETRNYCVQVPYCEQRTEMVARKVKVPYVEMCSRVVDHSHYECHEEPVGPTLMERICHKKKHDDCCDPCPKTKMVKKWVSCKVTECYPVTKCRWECVYEPCVRTVTCYRTENRTCTVPVNRVRCVPCQHTETYTVCCPKTVAVACKRIVPVCVPVVETVTCCRMVPHMVQKQVACCMPVCCH